ncbi:DUF7553 family protein [Halobacterium litoreum]|uniref:Uncharacterized protein n=1 Tax=Halobacterium litoreum TaxID=2039234 RepID=A0ABD5NFE9_9EURY|nr:hypothetical protein [Halobacterium litoreum]UHH13254.1 hypothetical protein LT972_13985 [Halobacterium litoreum]
MTRDHLTTAAELLDDASERADGDLGERLRGQADALFALADRDRGPDHGRLDRHMHALRDIESEADDDLAETVERALAELTEYRSGVEGV